MYRLTVYADSQFRSYRKTEKGMRSAIPLLFKDANKYDTKREWLLVQEGHPNEWKTATIVARYDGQVFEGKKYVDALRLYNNGRWNYKYPHITFATLMDQGYVECPAKHCGLDNTMSAYSHHEVAKRIDRPTHKEPYRYEKLPYADTVRAAAAEMGLKL